MKPSAYNIFIDNPETDETILYNTLYGSTIACNQEEVATIKEILDAPSTLGSHPHELLDVLIKQKFMILAEQDELSIVIERKRSGVEDTNRLDVILMPTQECNFACSYCYEKNHTSPMSDETEDNIKMWLKAEIPKHKVTMLLWFGGEPLIAFRRILSLTTYAANVAKKAGVTLIRHMTTNGYLFDKGKIDDLLAVGILDYQITIDGPPKVHNKFRCLKNGGETFDRVHRNVIDLARSNSRVKISLRVNFNHENLHDIPKLLEMVPEDIRNQLRIVFEPIFGDCTMSAVDNLPAGEISEALADYYELAREHGYDVVHGLSGIYPGKLVYCYAERQSQYVINYNGDVFKCSVTDFTPEKRVGHIGENGIFIKNEEEWDKWVGSDYFDDCCYSCVYLPLCMGGCRKVRLASNGSGTVCSLVPTNASYLLKKLAFCGAEEMLRR